MLATVLGIHERARSSHGGGPEWTGEDKASRLCLASEIRDFQESAETPAVIGGR